MKEKAKEKAKAEAEVNEEKRRGAKGREQGPWTGTGKGSRRVPNRRADPSELRFPPPCSALPDPSVGSQDDVESRL